MQFVVLGVLDAGLLILATLGFALVSRVNKFLNIAHAELIHVGALTTWVLSVPLHLDFVLSAVIAVAVTSLVGLAVGHFVFDAILKQPPEVLLIVSVGVAFLFHGLADATVSPAIKSFALPALLDWKFGSVHVSPYQLGILLAALIAVLLLHLYLTRTRAGTAIRAISDNRELAEIRGIGVRVATRNVWLVASALAGLAGVALGMVGTLTNDLPFNQMLLILSVAVLAGLGSIYGVVVAAFIVSVAMDMSTIWISPGWQNAVAFLIIMVALLVRPQGLFGVARRTA
jgi:branched-chain amino acid transport system permease protein